MSDNTLKAVKAYLYNQNRNDTTTSIDSMHKHEMSKGKRAKRTLDAQRTNQNYYRTQTIQQPLLDHYENVDWWERDTMYDFSSHNERK